jgi:hypothetical protein
MATEPVPKVPEDIVVEYQPELVATRPWVDAVVKKTGGRLSSILPRIVEISCMAGILASAAVLGYGSLFHDLMPAPRAAFLMAVMVLTGTGFVLFVRSLETEKRLFIESHWGGLGGGLGGWRVSRSLTYLLVTVPLALLLWHGMQIYPIRTDTGYRLERYVPAIDEAQRQNVKQLVVTVSGQKLHLTGIAPNVTAVDAVWNLIKQANPAYDDIEVNFTIQK